MNREQSIRIARGLGAEQRVVDVGGGAAPFWRADWVVDAIPFAAAGKLAPNRLGPEPTVPEPPRYREETWVELDLCDRTAWPFDDDQFDFAVCSHLLEDVRDPIWICSELSRIAKAGYIEVPSRYVEQSLGIEHPRFAGYYHHRWLVSVEESELVFRHKPHLLHATRDAIVADLGVSRRINPAYEITTLFWTGTLRARESLEFDEQRVVDELVAFARASRGVDDLVVSRNRTLIDQIRRVRYFRRLARGKR